MRSSVLSACNMKVCQSLSQEMSKSSEERKRTLLRQRQTLPARQGKYHSRTSVPPTMSRCLSSTDATTVRHRLPNVAVIHGDTTSHSRILMSTLSGIGVPT